MHWGTYGYGMGFGGGFMLLFWVIVIAAVVYAVAIAARSGRTGLSHMDSPPEIAKKRYARGEITKEEYLKIKEDLRRN